MSYMTVDDVRILIRGDTDDIWKDQAACRGVGPGLFFSERCGGDEPLVAAALQYCRRCPVIDACRDYALADIGNRWGIWGGLTQGERKNLRKQRRRQS